MLLKRRSLPVVSAQGIGLLRYAGFMSSALAPALWMRRVALIGPARMSNFTNLVPPLTVVVGVAPAQWGSATHRPG
ncbi:hypothetical protein [Roseococcus sp.]|uniref:hypothetical protein n=1 Tax=Roseococcus sp. TaxID=2109646 RepID=UPI003BA8C3D1